MRISTFFYCLSEGMKNIIKNFWFSLASTATISACIFLFCLFFALFYNINFLVKQVEGTVGITVLFEESLVQAEIAAIGKQIEARVEVKELTYISEEEAWESFKEEYFKGNEELAEGFADDNPLAGSSSYHIFVHDLNQQEELVTYIQNIEGVRQVNYSSEIISGFANINSVISAISAVIVGVLFAVSLFLINNTISMSAAFRKSQIQIMRLIGATNFMIRVPFIVEGVMIGIFGAIIPLAAIYIIYVKAIEYITQRYVMLASETYFLPISQIYPQMIGVALVLGVGIGFLGSFFTIRKYLKV